MLTVFIVSYLVVLAATPLAIRVARSTVFLDRPRGYRTHANPTPYLGGAAVLLGFLAAAAAGGVIGDARYAALFAGAGLLWLLGTIDDWAELRVPIRVLAEAAVAVLLWKSGLGWSIFEGEVVDLVLWIVGLVNAFNLMDNLDGAADTVAAVSAAGIALLTVTEGAQTLTALAVARRPPRRGSTRTSSWC